MATTASMSCRCFPGSSSDACEAISPLIEPSWPSVSTTTSERFASSTAFVNSSLARASGHGGVGFGPMKASNIERKFFRMSTPGRGLDAAARQLVADALRDGDRFEAACPCTNQDPSMSGCESPSGPMTAIDLPASFASGQHAALVSQQHGRALRGDARKLPVFGSAEHALKRRLIGVGMLEKPETELGGEDRAHGRRRLPTWGSSWR